MASSDKGFLDIARSLELIASQVDKTRLLVIGVAHGQEPLSVLSVFNAIGVKRGSSLKDVVDLNLIDIKPELSPAELQYSVHAWLMDYLFPGENFVSESLAANGKMLEVKDSVRDYLLEVMADPTKAKMGTAIQTYIPPAPDVYDVIVYNNTHGHVPDSPEKNRIYSTLDFMLAENGILITDPWGEDEVSKSAEGQGKTSPRRIYPGIFQGKFL